jgi:putative tryptophan/tyrosine transport system substrate-binding protein
MRRREFIRGLGGTVAAWPLAARGAQSGGSRRVAVLIVAPEHNPSFEAELASLRDALAPLGWIDGKNIKFEYHWLAPDKALIQQAAQDIVATQPDMIISAGSSPGTAALHAQTQTIPILFINIVEPVGQGFVASLSRPGGNITGFVNLETSMAGKWLELLKQVMPQATRAAIPYNPPTSPYAELYLNHFNSAARSFGLEIAAAPVADMEALQAFVAGQPQAGTGLIPVPSAFMGGHQVEICSMGVSRKLPIIAFSRAFAEAGALIGYGSDTVDIFRHAASYVDRILKGEKPSELPVQFPVKFQLVINIRTAKAIGLEVPPTLLARADEVIE